MVHISKKDKALIYHQRIVGEYYSFYYYEIDNFEALLNIGRKITDAISEEVYSFLYEHPFGKNYMYFARSV